MLPYDGPHCPPAAVEVQGFACQSALGFSQQHEQLGLIEDYKTMISHMEKNIVCSCIFVDLFMSGSHIIWTTVWKSNMAGGKMPHTIYIYMCVCV